MSLIVDAHEDLAWNMLTFGRDYTRSAAETRHLEAGSATVENNGDTLLGWEDYQRGRVALVFSTLFASPLRRRLGEWETLTYDSYDQARDLYLRQMDAYRRLCDSHPSKYRLVQTRADLDQVLTRWSTPARKGHAVGLVPLMENAEGVRDPDELAEWWELGLRLIGPAWSGTRFCGGTREPGPLTDDGRRLLDGMAALGFALDLSHMDEQSALQALDTYPGRVLISHGNLAGLLPGALTNRHISDRLLRGLLEREAVIGVVPFNRFLDTTWQKGDPRERVGLERVVAHIDAICQAAGNARQVGIGSDFDGGFGLQSVPAGIDTVADLQKIGHLLLARGYAQADVDAVLGGNWIQLLREVLP